MRHQRAGLRFGCVLPEGDEEIVVAVQKRADVFGIGGEAVIGGNCQNDGALIAKVRFAGKRYRAVGDPGRQLCKGVARAGGDDERVEQLFRADGLHGGYGVQDLVIAEGF